ncbi:MAG: calcium-binding protein [Rubrobacter sp.]
MRKLTLLTVLVGMMLALGATAALAAVINGTAGNDKLTGTNQADQIDARAGNDRVYGKGGNDTLEGSLGNDLLQSSTGNDRLFGGLSRDTAQAGPGDDRIVLDGDQERDYGFCGGGYDTIEVGVNDFIGDSSGGAPVLAGTIVESINPILSCERIIVNDVLVVAVPRV